MLSSWNDSFPNSILLPLFLSNLPGSFQPMMSKQIADSICLKTSELSTYIGIGIPRILNIFRFWSPYVRVFTNTTFYYTFSNIKTFTRFIYFIVLSKYTYRLANSIDLAPFLTHYYVLMSTRYIQIYIFLLRRLSQITLVV